MITKLKNLILNNKPRKTLVLAICSVGILVITSIGIYSYVFANNDSDKIVGTEKDSIGKNSRNEDITVAMVGEEESSTIGSSTQNNNSWPGEIISLNNLQIQPDREGTISQWFVHIGERVYSGQVIGKLSRPPQTPEMINMLGEKAQMLSESQNNTEALRTYTAKRILQLQKLRTGTASSSKDINSSVIEVKTKMARAILRGSFSRVYPMITGFSVVPISEKNLYFQMKETFGIRDIDTRIDFVNNIYKMLIDLKDPNILPEKTGLLYFEKAIRLADASYSGELLTEENLEIIKQMLLQDQSEFIKVLEDIKSTELDADKMITELEKELATSEGEFKSKKIAYETARDSIAGGYSIIATNSGIVSSITKKPGEFIGPGMPVATITADGNEGMLVRIRIPNNIQKPKAGEFLSVVRPGFGTDIQKIRLIGVGSSLDTDGSYMADAVFEGTTNWPVGSSVRVLVPASSSSVLIKYSSVFWDNDGSANVWTVSEAERIFSKKITIGRTLGSMVEVYSGLKKGDHYIVNPNSDVKENIFLSDIVKVESKENNPSAPAKSGGHENMPGM
jgi:multidrug efflux pump subunit AcrA (membrane-fusion protein)